VVSRECAATDAARLRLDEAEHRLRRDHRVDRSAAVLEHALTGGGGQRVGGHDHVALGDHRRVKLLPPRTHRQQKRDKAN
jgi:hypothetical protein